VRRASRSVPARLVQRYVDANLPNVAAAVAFHTLFSLFPLLRTRRARRAVASMERLDADTLPGAEDIAPAAASSQGW
jgi:uncharacterized BrkB/YihY/UPF0761 family membrane protein